MAKCIKLNVAGKNKNIPVNQAIELLGRIAERIYVDKHEQELAPLLSQRYGYDSVWMSLGEFLSLRPRSGRLFNAYSGPCVLKDPAIGEKQRATIQTIETQLGDYVDGNVHGGTMWGFIRNVHELSVSTKKLSIGVMPWRGLLDLECILDKLPDNFPKMNYLAVVGDDYGDHANVFGALPDSVVLLGGRKGAYLEAKAARVKGKFVLCHDIEGDSEAIATFEEGKIVLPTPDNIVSFIKRNVSPDQRIFNGENFEFEQFDRYLMENKIVNLGFVSTSGAFTNYPYFRKVLENLLSSGVPAELQGNVEITSGGTRYGGVWVLSDVCKAWGFRCNGVMCGKGLDLPWADVGKMVYVGNEWGDESSRFNYLSDILIGFSGGGQAKEEMKRAAQCGGRYSWNNGIPVIALYDELARGATYDLKQEGFTHPNLHYFHTSKLHEASDFLKEAIKKSYRDKK